MSKEYVASCWWHATRTIAVVERQAADTVIRMFVELLGGLGEAVELYAAETDQR